MKKLLNQWVDFFIKILCIIFRPNKFLLSKISYPDYNLCLYVKSNRGSHALKYIKDIPEDVQIKLTSKFPYTVEHINNLHESAMFAAIKLNPYYYRRIPNPTDEVKKYIMYFTLSGDWDE